MDESTKRFILGVDIARTLEMLDIHGTFTQGRWTASCPNGLLGHQGKVDEHPSWTVRDDIHNEAHGVHACWSCGYSGNIISLVRDVLNLKTWEEAKAWIQTHSIRGQIFAPLHIEVEVVLPRVNATLSIPEGVHPLWNSAGPYPYHSHPYRMYWLKRDFTLDQARRWDIGYSTRGSTAGRIWIPIRNVDHQLVNWTSRSITDREPRYLRAPSSENPDKGVLFGEEKWWNGPSEDVAVMEGELNAIRIDSVFNVQVAAVGGGAKLNPIHAAKLMQFERLIVFADGDKTGDKLTDQLRDLGKPMAVIRFSKGYDPCSVPVSELLEYGERCQLQKR